MKKRNFWKKALIGVGAIFGVALISGCTKSFCSINDQACLYGAYVDENEATILETSKTNGYLAPGDDYWAFIDNKVDTAFAALRILGAADYAADGDYSNDYVPASYLESNTKYNLATTTEEEKSSLVNDTTIKYIIRYAGFDDNGSEVLWHNFDNWTKEANTDAALKDKVPTAAFLSNYKSQISTGVGSAVTCITPTSGYFGTNENTYVEGKTWGQAFKDYGFIEGLLVYPIGWLVYTFAVAFGASGTNATGQILAIFLTTLIVRFFIVLASVGSSNSQNKMNDIQPQIALIKAKYPNSETNKYEQQKMTEEAMSLYKKSGIHPFRQILVLILQFPIFIAVWGALQGSAILTKGSILGLSLSTTTFTGIKAGNPMAIILFLLMSISQFFASMIPTWISNYHKKKVVGASTVKVDENPTASMMKYLPVIMMVFVIIMGLNLASAMGFYWLFGALISIAQAIITEIVNCLRKRRGHNHKNDVGGGVSYGRSGSFKDVKVMKKKKHMDLR